MKPWPGSRWRSPSCLQSLEGKCHINTSDQSEPGSLLAVPTARSRLPGWTQQPTCVSCPGLAPSKGVSSCGCLCLCETPIPQLQHLSGLAKNSPAMRNEPSERPLCHHEPPVRSTQTAVRAGAVAGSRQSRRSEGSTAETHPPFEASRGPAWDRLCERPAPNSEGRGGPQDTLGEAPALSRVNAISPRGAGRTFRLTLGPGAQRGSRARRP